MYRQLFAVAVIACVVGLAGCKRESESATKKPAADAAKPAPKKVEPARKDEGVHTHADGSTHDDHAEAEPAKDHGHAHDEVDLGTVKIGDLDVGLAQGHGKLAAAKEGHLVVKLPYNDKGQTIVRAWIGTEDRTLSFVGKGTYAPSHDDYDVHATAPNPLPEKVMWWIEIQKPDGTKLVGSAKPLLD